MLFRVIVSRSFCLLLLIATVGFLHQSCHGARTYQLVDYPSLQAGHRLTGTISTVDDAHLDSILEADEILAWDWCVTGPRVVQSGGKYSAFHDEHSENLTVATRVGISALTIELPLATPANKELAELSLRAQTVLGGDPFPLGEIGHQLDWQSQYYDDGRGQFDRYAAYEHDGDATNVFWFDDNNLGSSTKLIARFVPEPSAATLSSIALVGWLLNRWRRSNSPLLAASPYLES